jgi:hypothetical protein
VCVCTGARALDRRGQAQGLLATLFYQRRIVYVEGRRIRPRGPAILLPGLGFRV